MVVSNDTQCAHVYDATLDSLGPCKAFYDFPRRITGVDRVGTLWVTWGYAYDAAFNQIRNIERPWGAGAASPTPDAQYLYVTTAAGLDFIRFADWFVEKRIATPWIEQGHALVTQDGRLFVGIGSGNGTRTRIAAVELN